MKALTLTEYAARAMITIIASRARSRIAVKVSSIFLIVLLQGLPGIVSTGEADSRVGADGDSRVGAVSKVDKGFRVEAVSRAGAIHVSGCDCGDEGFCCCAISDGLGGVMVADGVVRL